MATAVRVGSSNQPTTLSPVGPGPNIPGPYLCAYSPGCLKGKSWEVGIRDLAWIGARVPFGTRYSSPGLEASATICCDSSSLCGTVHDFRLRDGCLFCFLRDSGHL